MKYFMHVFYKRCLAAAVAFLMVGMAMAQSDVTMEVTDIFGDTYNVPLSGDMTMYVPQGGNYSQLSLVMCDASGKPVWSFPVRQLSSIRYIGAPTSSATPELPEASDDYPYQTWVIQGKPYRVMRPGEWHLSSDLKMQTLTTADGKRYEIPLSAVDAIQLNEIVGMAHYLDKWAEDAAIYRWAFYNGSIESMDKMHLNFYAYVPEHRQLNASLIVPDDEALSHWIDVVSLESLKPRMLNLTYRESGIFPIGYRPYKYDPSTGTLGSTYNFEKLSEEDIANRLRFMLRSHLIIHRPEDGTLGLRSGNEYFQAMDGSIVHVILEDGQPKALQGTFQLWNQAQGIKTMKTEDVEGFEGIRLDRCNIKEQRAQDGGWIYRIDSPMEATPLSAYAALSADETEANPFRRFLELCMPTVDFNGYIIPNEVSSSKRQQLEKYLRPFIQQGGNDYNLSYVSGQPFTLYVPTNEAIDQEIAAGRLFTWEDIAADISSSTPEEGNVADEDRLRISQKMETLLNFIRAHVQFGVEIADQLPFERTHNTALVLPKTLRTPQLKVKSVGKGQLTVTDEQGNTRHVLDAHKNIFVRDMHCTRNYKDQSPKGQTTMNNIVLNDYSTGVIHQIDGVLNYNAE